MKPASEILKKSRAIKSAAAITPHVSKLLDAAQAIQAEPDAAEAAFMARQLVQCTLPHANPGDVPVWSRTNGNLTLGIQPGVNLKTGKSIGYPYGTIPRLLLFWITTEAVQTSSRRLELGNSLSGFMRQLGLTEPKKIINGREHYSDTGRGKRGNATRLKEQMRRLFAAHISFEQTLSEGDRAGIRWLDMKVAPKGELWWDPKHPDQDTLWGSWIELGEDFYEAITTAPVPVDMRALRALKRSPLALDLYAWASYRAYAAAKKNKAQFIPWTALMNQLGTDYTDKKDFKRYAKAALGKIQAVYKDLALTYEPGGVTIHPSRPAIAEKPAKRTAKPV